MSSVTLKKREKKKDPVKSAAKCGEADDVKRFPKGKIGKKKTVSKAQRNVVRPMMSE